MSDPKNTRCIICDTVGEWENVDHLKNTKTGLSICQNCGFVTHIDQLRPKEEIKAYYKKDYRPAPMALNFFTGQRKLHYHQAFLGELFDEWGKNDRKPDIFESGTAYGLFLKWAKDYLKAKGTEANVSGSEWTETFKRVCYYHHGIQLHDEIDESKKYDMVASYKVLEHQVDADKELRKFVELLKDDGLIYIGVPIWFERLSNFGVGGFDIEYYYHKDHINVWTQKLFRTLLKKAGLEIIKENGVYYDWVFLCKRNDALMDEKPEYENPAEIKKTMEKIQKAENLKLENKFKEAIEVFPNFPLAWINHYEKNRNKFNELGIDGIHKEHLQFALDACPGSVDIVSHVADVHSRYGNYEAAVHFFDQALDMSPGNAAVLTNRAQALVSWGESCQDPKDKIKWFQEARGTLYHAAECSAQKKFDCLNWIYKIESMLPLPQADNNNGANTVSVE